MNHIQNSWEFQEASPVRDRPAWWGYYSVCPLKKLFHEMMWLKEPLEERDFSPDCSAA